MPASKTASKWSQIIADEFNFPEESLWLTSISGERTFVFIWTEKLNKRDLERLTSSKSAGGHTTLRAKLSRFLQDLNADGWFTKVKPNEARPQDLHPITPHVPSFRSYCSSCRTELYGVDELHTQKCAKCTKVASLEPSPTKPKPEKPFRPMWR